MSKQAGKKSETKSGKNSDQKSKAATGMATFEKYFEGRKGLYLFLALVCFIGIAIFWDYLTFKNVYLFKDIGSDSVNIAYPYLVHVQNYLRTEGIPKWSFNHGMGQNLFPFILRDPFDFILYTLDKDHLPYGIVYVELLKIILTGFFFYLYLRLISLPQFSSIIGGLLVSYSGFLILGSGWYIFTYEALCTAFLLYAFEKVFVQDKWLLFPIPIALIAASMPFNLYIYGVFLFVYVLLRFFHNANKRKAGPKKLFLLLLKLSLLGLLGVALSGTFLFSNILQLLESPRVSGQSSFISTLLSTPLFGVANSVNNITAIFRLFSSDLLGTGLGFRGAYNYLEAPLLYCGLLTLLLVPQVFSFTDKRTKIMYILYLSVWILPIIFPFFRYTFWLYTGDYYRAYSFFVSLALIYTGVQALAKIESNFKVNLIVLALTLIVLLIMLYYPYFPAENPVNKDLRNVVVLFLFAYSILIIGLQNKELKFPVQVIILLVVSAELIYLCSITANKRLIVSDRELNQRTGYNDYTNEVLSYIKNSDKGWYRIDKYYSSGPAVHNSINDAEAQNYKSTPSYDSFNQKYYINFLQEVELIKGTDETQTRWSQGLRGWPLLEIFGSVKYILSKNGVVDGLYSTCDSITQIEDIKLFKPKFYLPLGFTYSKYSTASDFKKMSHLQKQITLLRNFVVEDSSAWKYKDFQKSELKDTVSNYSFNDLDKDVRELKTDTLEILSENQNNIKGKITLKENKMLFLSIPYDKGWSATIDGKKTELQLINIGFMGIPLTLGEHNLELIFTPRFVREGIILSLFSFLLYGFFVLKNFKSKETHLGK